MKRYYLIFGLTFFLTGCQQFNDTIAAVDEKIAGANKAIGDTFGKKNTEDKNAAPQLSVITGGREEEICAAFRQDPDGTRAKYIGKLVFTKGEAQCRIYSLATIRVNNVVLTARDENMINWLRMVLRENSPPYYFEPTGTITGIQDLSKNNPKDSDCVISADLKSFYM